ncbi:MAG: FecR domain-containing protein [Proteobacteria bacterium]|nr:FecR domain-containing protein [Pseudomonadota bacterium]
MKRLKLLAGLVVFLLIDIEVSAAPVGTLTLEKGIVKVRRNLVDAIYREPGKQVPVHNRDEIQTGTNTRVRIDLTDKEENIVLSSHTFFTISAVDKEKSEVFLPVGKARFLVKKRGLKAKKGRRRFRLRTVNAIIGVKGTKWVTGVINGNTSVLTLEGAVSMASIALPDVEVEVPVNQASKVRQDAAPTAPVTVPPEVREAIVAEDSPAVFDNVEFGAEVKEPEAKKDKKEKKKTEEGEKPKPAGESEPAEIGVEESPIEESEMEEPEIDIEDILEEVTEVTEEAAEEATEQVETQEEIETEKTIKFIIIDQ